MAQSLPYLESLVGDENSIELDFVEGFHQCALLAVLLHFGNNQKKIDRFHES